MIVPRGICVAMIAFALAISARTARAQPVGCALAPCPDADSDGFMRCDCAPAGVACDCDDANGSVYPGAPEACDSPVDLSCNGIAGDKCAPMTGCYASVCVGRCIPLDDFGCPPDTHCENRPPDDARLCIPNDCSIYGCPPGSTCDDAKKCVPTCSPEVNCPFGLRCRGDGCVDPCANIACPEGAACVEGRCERACTCVGVTCAGTFVCDAPTGRCVEGACAGVPCGPGTHCENGACVDDCAGVVCPTKRVCRVRAGRGTCVDLCNPDPCTSAYECQWRTGECKPRPIAEGGLTPDDPAGVLGAGFRLAGGGCACGEAQFSRGSALGAALMLAGIIASRLRRRGSALGR